MTRSAVAAIKKTMLQKPREPVYDGGHLQRVKADSSFDEVTAAFHCSAKLTPIPAVEQRESNSKETRMW